jgi:hypothetical protein
MTNWFYWRKRKNFSSVDSQKELKENEFWVKFSICNWWTLWIFWYGLRQAQGKIPFVNDFSHQMVRYFIEQLYRHSILKNELSSPVNCS